MLLRLLLIVLLLGTATASPAEEAPRIAVLGDSLSAAYGLEREREGWVTLLQDRLTAEGHPHQVINAATSGDTTRQALNRLAPLLEAHSPEVLVVQLGGNDGLRALPPAETRRNLSAIIEMGQSAGAEVLLVGIRLPPNYGPAYNQRFEALFHELAEDYDVPLVPFLLEGIATDDALMQDDRIHPNAKAQPKMLELVWPELVPLL
ncbi:arylesterase [Alkalilimnicola ehrlichii MLHE-1]|uniref:Arylesterase n=1 Tax=Alkalilimnicola ehrlichii (strain ATCC BAA-1101 / DSM 17681 / MLHE-1) TaxID=187272 RepID=Q0A5Y8_ALKEH|nr:arylesterase [Alkalilimnicola ehrlichii]ABI57749.1 Arylesterase [Alkalilimnicola ehrlichii MLHE-1]